MSVRVWLGWMLTWTTMVSCASTLQSLVVNGTAGKTSILCVVKGNPVYHGFTLSAPNRAVIDFQQTRPKIDISKVSVGHGVIQRIRVGYPNPKTLRIVFDLNQASTIKIVQWKSGMTGPEGLRIDILPKVSSAHQTLIQRPRITNAPVAQRHVSSPKLPPQKKIVPKTVVPRRIQPIAMRDIVVVIDAGHGGKDPGAIGPRRSVEKNIVLNIAFKLKQLIDRQPGMRAVMTRRGDYYVGLRERLNITRKFDADMFVSIHADAFNNKQSNGASVYALSQGGATSEAARWLAEKENYSELGGVNLSGLDDTNGLVRTVLLDLSQTATINAGRQVGSRVLSTLNLMTTLHHHKVEQARFVVLKSPDIPSILVETGFISNPREEFNLTNAYYQNKLTNAIFNGVKQYFQENPPHGSRMEAMMGGIRNVYHTQYPQYAAQRARKK